MLDRLAHYWRSYVLIGLALAYVAGAVFTISAITRTALAAIPESASQIVGDDDAVVCLSNPWDDDGARLQELADVVEVTPTENPDRAAASGKAAVTGRAAVTGHAGASGQADTSQGAQANRAPAAGESGAGGACFAVTFMPGVPSEVVVGQLLQIDGSVVFERDSRMDAVVTEQKDQLKVEAAPARWGGLITVVAALCIVFVSLTAEGESRRAAFSRLRALGMPARSAIRMLAGELAAVYVLACGVGLAGGYATLRVLKAAGLIMLGTRAAMPYLAAAALAMILAAVPLMAIALAWAVAFYPVTPRASLNARATYPVLALAGAVLLYTVGVSPHAELPFPDFRHIATGLVGVTAGQAVLFYGAQWAAQRSTAPLNTGYNPNPRPRTRRAVIHMVCLWLVFIATACFTTLTVVTASAHASPAVQNLGVPATSTASTFASAQTLICALLAVLALVNAPHRFGERRIQQRNMHALGLPIRTLSLRSATKSAVAGSWMIASGVAMGFVAAALLTRAPGWLPAVVQLKVPIGELGIGLLVLFLGLISFCTLQYVTNGFQRGSGHENL